MSHEKAVGSPVLNSRETTNRFKGYVVLVTGGCSGIGKATVERFANDGATVYALDLRLQGEDTFRAQFQNQVACITLDVADGQRCIEVVKEIAAQHNGTIHTLANVAGCLLDRPGSELDDEGWERTYQVNVKGHAHMAQAVKPYMAPGQGCSIVNVSSMRAHRAATGWAYTASKGAISSLTRCMAVDLSGQGIRVNCVSPGPIFTAMMHEAVEHNDRKACDIAFGRLTVMGRTADPEEVASVITFLASRDASFVTGVDIPVCGGGSALHGFNNTVMPSRETDRKP